MIRSQTIIEDNVPVIVGIRLGVRRVVQAQ